VHRHRVELGLALLGWALTRDWVGVGLAGLANGPSMGYAGERTGENQLGLAWVGAGFWPIAKQEQGNPSPIFKYIFSYN
jgi:hypothetical protein